MTTTQTTIAPPEILDPLCEALQRIAEGGTPFGPFPATRPHADPDRPMRRGARSAPPKEPAPDAPDADGWPEGPAVNGRALGAGLVRQAAAAVIAYLGAADEGLTRARLRAALEAGGVDGPTVGRVAPALLLWFARAGWLAPAADPAAPWAGPRPLTTLDAAAVRDLLRACPPPAPAEVAAERARGLR